VPSLQTRVQRLYAACSQARARRTCPATGVGVLLKTGETTRPPDVSLGFALVPPSIISVLLMAMLVPVPLANVML
jgi:hypothetical protein